MALRPSTPVVPELRTLLVCLLFVVTAIVLRVDTAGAQDAAGELASFEVAELAIGLSERASQYRITIRPRGGVKSLPRDLTADVFAIENPTRLVVDIPGFRADRPRTIDVKSSLVTAIRMGVHEQKTRLVLDFSADVDPVYDIRSDPALGALVIDFTFRDAPAAQTARNIPAEEPPARSPTPAPTVPALPAAPPEEASQEAPLEEPVRELPDIVNEALEEAAEEQAALEEEPELPSRPPQEPLRAPTPAAQVQPDPSPPVGGLESEAPATPGVATVKGIFYQTTKNSDVSSVVIDVTDLNTYSLSQRDANAYELILEKAQLRGAHLSLPQFPPDTFRGFEVIVANQSGNNVVVKIYVEDGVKLTPFIAKGRLWLRVAQ